MWYLPYLNLCTRFILLLCALDLCCCSLYKHKFMPYIKHWKFSFLSSLRTKREPIYYATVCTQFIMSNKFNLFTRNLHLLEVNFSLLGNPLGCG
jgi:hypothetical protein